MKRIGIAIAAAAMGGIVSGSYLAWINTEAPTPAAPMPAAPPAASSQPPPDRTPSLYEGRPLPAIAELPKIEGATWKAWSPDAPTLTCADNAMGLSSSEQQLVNMDLRTNRDDSLIARMTVTVMRFDDQATAKRTYQQLQGAVETCQTAPGTEKPKIHSELVDGWVDGRDDTTYQLAEMDITYADANCGESCTNDGAWWWENEVIGQTADRVFLASYAEPSRECRNANTRCDRFADGWEPWRIRVRAARDAVVTAAMDR